MLREVVAGECVNCQPRSLTAISLSCSSALARQRVRGPDRPRVHRSAPRRLPWRRAAVSGLCFRIAAPRRRKAYTVNSHRSAAVFFLCRVRWSEPVFHVVVPGLASPPCRRRRRPCCFRESHMTTVTLLRGAAASVAAASRAAFERIRPPPISFPWKYSLELAIVFTSYFVAGQVGFAAPFTTGNVSPVWPPAGIALAALLLVGYRVWPAIAAGAFLVNFLSPISLVGAIALAAGNTAGPVVGAWLVQRLPGFRPAAPTGRPSTPYCSTWTARCSTRPTTTTSGAT